MSTVALRVRYNRDDYAQVEMPGATTIRYAARRVAEALGHGGDEGDFRLFVAGQRAPDCGGV